MKMFDTRNTVVRLWTLLVTYMYWFDFFCQTNSQVLPL